MDNQYMKNIAQHTYPSENAYQTRLRLHLSLVRMAIVTLTTHTGEDAG